MLNNLGQAGDMMKMMQNAKKLQEKLENTIIRSKGEGIYIDMTATGKCSGVTVENEELLKNKNKLEEEIKNLINKAKEKTEQVVAMKTEEILGINPENFKNMFGM